jgi:hypothetical protein
MIYWTEVPDLDERFDLTGEASPSREREFAGRRARLVRWSLILWVSQLVVMALYFAFV